jgi:hypothetical protein
MNPLKKYDDAAEARDNAPVREYAAYVAEKGFPERLLDVVPRAEKALAIAQKLATRIAREYPIAGNDNRPPWLKDNIGQLHSNCVQPVLRGLYASLPARLTAWAGKIKDAKPADFKFFSPETLARCDIERAESLMGEVQRLEEIPARLSEAEGLIKEWLASPTGGGRYSAPPPAPAFTPRPLPPDHGDPDEPLPVWDSRTK